MPDRLRRYTAARRRRFEIFTKSVAGPLDNSVYSVYATG